MKQISEVKSETEMLLDLLKHFKGTRPEYTDIINEVMKI